MKRLSLAAILALLVTACGGSVHSAAPPTLPTPAQAAHAAQTSVPSEHLAHPRLDATVRPGLSGPAPLTAVLTLRGEDAVTITNIPLGEPVVGCYAAGSFANCTAARARFPHSHIVTISPTALVAADVLDVEPGDAMPSQAPTFYNVAKHAGIARPGFYASLGNGIVPTRADLEAAGHPRSSFLLWVAAWDGNPSIPSGYDAHQWCSNAFIDCDTFGSWFFGKPTPPPFNYHYERYPTITLSIVVNSRHLRVVERSVVQEYDKLRPHATKNHRTLLRLRYEMQSLYHRIHSLNKTRVPAVTAESWGVWRADRLYERGFLAKRIG